MPTRTVLAAAVLFLIVATQPGCSTETSPIAQDTTELHSAAVRAATTVDTASAITYVSTYFAGAGSVSMRELSTAEVSPQLVAGMQSRVMADLADVSCVTVETDDRSFVHLTFDHCVGAHGKLNLTGTIGAQVAFESAPCGAAMCPVAVVYSVTTTDLRLGEASIVGDWQIHDPLAAGAPYTWAGLLQVVTPERGIVFTSSASFVQADDCVDLTIDSTAGGSGQRSFTSSATGVHRCMNACPTAGAMTVTTQDGDVVTWSYDGRATATVATEAETEFPIGFSCGT
jgi:hypothetical protein